MGHINEDLSEEGVIDKIPFPITHHVDFDLVIPSLEHSQFLLPGYILLTLTYVSLSNTYILFENLEHSLPPPLLKLGHDLFIQLNL